MKIKNSECNYCGALQVDLFNCVKLFYLKYHSKTL